MNWFSKLNHCVLPIAIALAGCLGCQHPRPRTSSVALQSPPSIDGSSSKETTGSAADVQLVSHRQQDQGALQGPSPPADSEAVAAPPPVYRETLEDLEAFAIANNPTLRRMQQEAAAEWAQVGYVGALPDPSVSSMVYTPPMHYEPDRLLAEFQVMQMIPWLDRLNAETQRAHLEAAAAENLYRAERLRVIGDLRAGWFQLYVLGKQIETTEADKAQLDSLVTTANARVATGNAQPGDVLMATLELSAQQEQLIAFRQQIAAVTAELNRLAGRAVSTPIAVPTSIDPVLPDWNHEMLRQVAMGSQPQLDAARMRTAATRWGVDVARLRRRPDLTFGAGWMVMDAPGAANPEAGRDSFSLAVTTTLPIWDRKYDAMTAEACREHAAAHASEDEIALQLESRLRELWEQARASQQTIELYEASILPQARQMFESNQQSLVNNTVTFERLIRDYRTLLNLELGYHRALGQLATTLARIRETVGVELTAAPVPAEPIQATILAPPVDGRGP